MKSWSNNPMTTSTLTIDDIFTIYAERADGAYGGERISQLEHALQCAALADEAGAGEHLVIAALLHDLGHLVHDLGSEPAARGVDDAHEHRGVRALAHLFAEDVLAPIRLHVDAKRYLCAVETDYFDTLSEVSVRSLQVQGGIFDEAGVAAFEQLDGWQDAVALRRWDEAAKVPDCQVPDMESYRQRLLACALPA
jgi:phosphonate degradation associated HDIG domain protein